MKKYLILSTALLTIFVIGSCKKDNSTTEGKPSLSGLSINAAPAFVAVGDEFTFRANISSLGVSKGTLPTVGLYWQVNTAKKDTLTRDAAATNPEYHYKVDSLGTYSVYCYAFGGSNYYNTSASSSFRAVDPAQVLSGLSTAQEITAGGLTWQASNLNYQDAGLSFRDSKVLDSAVGRLYSWTEAQTVCPAGWHLPGEEDFSTSFADTEGAISAGALMAGASFLGEEMWEYIPGVNITNSFGFNAIPLGYIDMVDPFTPYNKYGEYACYWTSSQEDGMGTYMYIYAAGKQMQKASGDKETLYMSVRCVKD